MKKTFLLFVLALILTVVFFACNKSSPTEVIVVITASYTRTPTNTATGSATVFCTPTCSPTFSATQTAWVLIATGTFTPTWTLEATPSDTATLADTFTVTKTITPANSPTVTATVTPACVVPYDGIVITQDTVLCPGTYDLKDPGFDGVIRIGAHNVTLDGNGAVVWDSTGVVSSSSGIRNETYYGVKIKNLIIRKYSININITNSSSNSVEHCLIENAGASGVFIGGNGQNNQILGNTFTANSSNIRISSGTSGNTVNANVINGGGYGVDMNFGAYANTITNNLISGCTRGVSMWENNHHNFIGSNVIRNGQTGIQVFDGSNTVILHNDIHTFSQDGISLSGPSTNVGISIHYNNIYDIAEKCIYNNLYYSVPGNDVEAEYNWLGGTDCAALAFKIYDKNDNASLSRVYFEPFLNAPYPGGTPVTCPPTPTITPTP